MVLKLIILFLFILVSLLAFLGYLLLRKLLPLLIDLIDKSTQNSRNTLSLSYEKPKYYVLNTDGVIDTTKRWWGWDGWYFLAWKKIPESASVIRGSIMTGLYGIEGIDNYEKLMLHLSSSDAAESLLMITQPKITPFLHEYRPKHQNLQIKPNSLDVKLAGRGEIMGKWPEYNFKISNPQEGLEVTLHYKARDIIWWADIPGVFTYFTTFGFMDGELKTEEGTSEKISSPGCFEHGYSKKLFDYDTLFLPIRLWRRLFPIKIVHYHYELFFTEEGMHGGIMKAKGFGIEVRNRGGIYLPDREEYVRIKKIRDIKYQKPRRMEIGCAARPETFYEQWDVEAETEKGILRYTAKQENPPAHTARHMIFYSFIFEGSLGSQRLSGKGYGEYACI